MKTTSHLGGRKAHTAKGRRVRYETSTRVRRVGMEIRMVRTLLHGTEVASSAVPVGDRSFAALEGEGRVVPAGTALPPPKGVFPRIEV